MIRYRAEQGAKFVQGTKNSMEKQSMKSRKGKVITGKRQTQMENND